MINFKGRFMAPEDISVIYESESNNPDYPYRLTVTTKSGEEYATIYASKPVRNTDLRLLVRSVDLARSEMRPLSDAVVRHIMQAELDKVRQPIRDLRKLIREVSK